MRTVDIHEAEENLSRLVDMAARGEEFAIAKAGKPLVKVVPLTPVIEQTARLGFLFGEIVVPDDFDTMGQSQIQQLFLGSIEG